MSCRGTRITATRPGPRSTGSPWRWAGRGGDTAARAGVQPVSHAPMITHLPKGRRGQRRGLFRMRTLSLYPDARLGRRRAAALFIMLNPSTATEVQNDPTVERCERRARALGFGAFRSSTSSPGAPPTRATCAPPATRSAPTMTPRSSSSLPWADQCDLRLGHPWRASGARPGGERPCCAGADPLAPGPVEGRPPEAPALYRLRVQPLLWTAD
jgi:hypothetical protein